MKFSIVTPTYNMAKWLPHTIESVLSQEGDFEIEYIVVDGNSTDETFSILKQYESELEAGTYPLRCKAITMQMISRAPTGMYGAINAGFAEATGDIYAWINSDDLYVPGALSRMQSVFEAFPDVEWAKGTSAQIDTGGNSLRDGIAHIYRQDWLQKGIYGMQSYFVEQDSVFWRSRLWKEVGGIPEHLRYAGDYWLWIAFAKYAKLWSIKAPISVFRKRADQLSKNVDRYKNEQRSIQGQLSLAAWQARLFFSIESRLVQIKPELRTFFTKLYPYFFTSSEEYIEPAKAPEKKRAISFIV